MGGQLAWDNTQPLLVPGAGSPFLPGPTQASCPSPSFGPSKQVA